MMTTLAEFRRMRNLSQVELAALIGVSPPAISRAENGHPVQRTTLRLICQALGVAESEITGVNVYRGVQAAAKRKRA